MAANVINGTDLCLFVTSGATVRCIALATTCSLAINMATRQISSKDSTGNWDENTSGRLSWTVDSDNLFTQDLGLSAYTYDNLVDMMIARQPITITLAKVTTDNMGYPQTKGTGKYLTGSALITSITANGPDQDNATFSVSMVGTGALAHA
jgi:predicted secreted protein